MERQFDTSGFLVVDRQAFGPARQRLPKGPWHYRWLSLVDYVFYWQLRASKYMFTMLLDIIQHLDYR